VTVLALSPFLAVDDNHVSPGALGFLVVAALGVATWLLIRSMNRQIKRIDLPDEHEASPGSAPGDTGDDRGVEGTDRPEPGEAGFTPR
jgi:hypothetical protein